MYNLLTLNVNGLNDHLKRTALIDWLKCMKADIVCLQETHASSHSSILSWFHHSSFRVASSSLSNKRCGVAILVNDTYNFTQVRKDDDGRFLKVEIDIEGNKLRFVSLYAPNKNPARNTFSSLPDFIDLAVPTFICGDFNAVLNPDLDRRHHPSYAGPSQGATARESVAALESLLSATHTFPVWRTRNPTERIFSWDHASGKFLPEST
jgi:exonuclease III